MSPRTQYAKTSDGTNIAYSTSGQGTIDVLRVPGDSSHLEHGVTEPSIARCYARLGAFARVTRMDIRGTGMSDRIVGAPTLEERRDDVRAVMDAAGIDRAVIYGASAGGSLACLFAATYPERVVALVLYAAIVKWEATEDFPWAHSAEVLDWALAEIEATFGDGPPLALFAPSVADDPSVKKWFGDQQRLASSPGAAGAMMELNRSNDIRAVLPAIKVPCLVLHRREDMVVNVEQSRYLARTIPGAKYVEFPGQDHLEFYGDADAVLDEIERFLTGSLREHDVDRVLATLLFTDMVGSTAHAIRLGDRRWRDLQHRHHGAIRMELERFRGREIDTAGDGFLATFEGPARAIRCAAAIRDAVTPLGVQIRSGLHTGEVELTKDGVAGIAVHIAARVGALAEGNEILVSRTVADLVAGSGTVFEDRGLHDLKGVPGRWQLLAAT